MQLDTTFQAIKEDSGGWWISSGPDLSERWAGSVMGWNRGT